jgi:hypothetical protein
MIGLRIFAIGELSISPSSSSQRENCCSDRYRVAAEEGGARKLGGDERLDVLTLDARHRGRHALVDEERGEQSAVVGVPANRAGRQVGRLQVETLRLRKYAKLAYARRCSGGLHVC